MGKKTDWDGFSRSSSARLACLRRIADVIGVPVEAFQTSVKSIILHTDAYGTSWFLCCDMEDILIVRRVSAGAGESAVTQESVFAFLARNEETPQRQALVTLINNVLARHLLD